MVYMEKSISVILLIFTCGIQQLISASCTLEIFQQSVDGKTSGLLSCPKCSLSLSTDNNCDLIEIASNCSGIECNGAYQPHNINDPTCTHLLKNTANIIASEQNDPIMTDCKSQPWETLNIMCTPATVTVCPKQGFSSTWRENPSMCAPASPTGAANGATIIKTSTVVITTVLCTPYASSNDTSKIECTQMRSTILAMGAVTGILVVLLVVMTAGYIFICWKMKKKGGIRFSLKQMASFPKTRQTIINTLNRTDKTLRRFNNPLYKEGGPDELPPPATGIDHSPVAQPRDGEPAYEAILPPGMTNKRSFEMLGSTSHHEANGDKQLQALGGVSVGVASQEGCGQGVLELSQVGLEDEDIENHYHLLSSEELDGQRLSQQELRDEDIENHYHLLDSEGEDEKMRHNTTNDKCNYHILEENKLTNQENNDVSTIESDYYLLGSVEETAEQEREESVYHVLEMPGHDDNDYEDPDEGELFQDYDERRRERETERSTRKAHACDVPVIS